MTTIQIPLFKRVRGNRFAIVPDVVALIDEVDKAQIEPLRWFISSWKNRTFYAQTTIECGMIQMHRLLIPIIPEGYVRHHEDGNGLNNTRANLKVITNKLNLQLQKTPINNNSGAIGVCRFGLKWKAYIMRDTENIHLGYFGTFDEAVAARKAAEIKYRQGRGLE